MQHYTRYSCYRPWLLKCLMAAAMVMFAIPVSAGNPPPYSAPNPILQESNRQPLSIYFQKRNLGNIDSYSYRGGYMLPLTALFGLLDLPIRVHPGDGLAQGTLAGQLFSLDVLERTISFGNKRETFDKALVTGNGGDIFMDASLLERFLPISFYVDSSALKLHIKLKKSLAEEEKDTFRSLWQGKKEQTSIAHKAKTASNPNQPPSFSDDTLLVLQPTFTGAVSEDFIEAYQYGERYFLPLDALVRLLEFPIEVDLINGTAEGWFIDKDHKFSLDMVKAKGKAAGKSFTFTPADAAIKDGDIFFDSALLEQWFGLGFNVSEKALTLTVTSNAPLPFQKKLERQQRQDQLKTQKLSQKDKHYPYVDTPYSLIDWPFLDLNLSHEYHNSEAPSNTTTYSLQTSGDLGYLDTKIFASGSSDTDALQTFRIQGERKDNDGNLLGFLHATEYSIGDIDSPTIPLVAQTSLGRGARISNRPLDTARDFDVTDFTGDAQPGWDIELYRNETLLDFQQVGNDGRYQFVNVPLLFGSNNFRLVFYGPQGQIEEQVKQVFLDSAALKKGQLAYELSVDEKSKDLLGLENTQLNHPEALRSVGSLEYGITDNVSARFGSISTPIQDGTHDYLTTGLRAGGSTIFGGADFAYDTTNNGWGASFRALTGIDDVNLSLEQRFFNHFASEERDPSSILATSQSEVDVNSYFKLPVLKEINTALNVLYEEFENGLKQTTVSNRLSKSILGVSLTNSLGAVLADQQDRFEGNLGLRGRIKSVLWGGIINYRLSPEKEIDSVDLSAQKNISQDLFLRLGLMRNLGLDKRTLTSGSLTWDLHLFRVTTLAETDNEGNIFVGTNLNISFGKLPGRTRWHTQSNPISYNGAVLAEAYLDTNYNQQWDDGEKPLNDAVFTIDNRKVKADKGSAFATQVIANNKTNVELEPEGLEDPLWQPGVAGYSITPRAGKVTSLQFPVFATSEIDGTVTVIDDYGNALPLKHGELVLLDNAGKIIKTITTEYDGFYLFDKVLPGEYTISVTDKTLKKYRLAQGKTEHVTITGKSDFFSGYDIQLTRLKEALPPNKTTEGEDEEYTETVTPTE